MKRLKCPDCGGQVKLLPSTDGVILGRCLHCTSEFIIELSGRKHIIVEHRFSGQPVRPSVKQAPLSRRAALGLGGAALAGSAIIAFGARRQTGPFAAAPNRLADVVFNVGGEGAGPGQFRDYIIGIGIDSLGRAALVDNQDRVYVFGPEGQFISHYSLKAQGGGRFCALLPSGDLLLADNDKFHRLSLESGELLESIETESDPRGWNARYSLTAQGGLAVYTTEGHGLGGDGAKAIGDKVSVFGPDLKLQRQVTGLLSQAIAPDPMVSDWPEVTAIALDGAGSFYLNIRAAEDHDLRGGIFEFNSDGKLLRRIEVEQSWHGKLAISNDKTLWYGDAWRNDLQRITVNGREILGLSGLADSPTEALGNVAAFALYPNGDLGVVTMNHRFARLRPTFAAA